MATLRYPKNAQYLTYWLNEGQWGFIKVATVPYTEMYYDGRFSHICVWDHVLSKEEIDRIQNGHYPYNVPGLLIYIANVEAKTDDWRQEAMKHNFEKGYGVSKKSTYNHYCAFHSSWSSDKQEDVCPVCGMKDRAVGPEVLPQFTHICTQCNSVFIGTMEDNICPTCKAKAEHTVQHADGPTFTHCCSKCRYVWSNDKTMDFDCPKCDAEPIATEGGTALDVQVGGAHYKYFKIQPAEFNIVNDIPFAEGNVIKYVCRWREKGGVEDLKKAIHYLQMLIELEGRQ